jgi:hypothetical protein
MRGWSLDVVPAPDEVAQRLDGMTLHVYPSREAFLDFKHNPKLSDYWKQVHPDMDLDATYAEYDKYRAVTREELWVVEDMITAKVMESQN